jgi:hypothetical protein
MEAKYRSVINDMHATTVKNLNLQQEIGRADSMNMSLRQDLNQAREVICGLKKRIMELEPPPGVATDSKNTDIHESDTVVQVSPDARVIELTQPEDGDNRLHAQETDSTIALVSKKVSPSPDDGGRQKAEKSQTIGEHGSQKYRKRGGRKRLRISCG